MSGVQRTSFSHMACSLARSLDAAGEWWTPLILRDLWYGNRRFDGIQRNLGLSRKVLANRLDTLVREGLVERRPYQERPVRHEYVLTEKGREMADILLAMISWGDRWTADESGPPMLLRHERCGEVSHAEIRCSSCGEPMHSQEVRIEPGPGARVGQGTRLVARLLDSD